MASNIYTSETVSPAMPPQDEILLRTLLATAPLTGDRFFQTLVSCLAALCQVKVAFCCELLLDMSSARGVAMFKDGGIEELSEYSLGGTPCGEAVVKGSSVYAESVARQFPDDVWLANMSAETYIAVVLNSASGDPIGLLGIVHDAPLARVTQVYEIIEALAPRVAAELERRQLENALRRSEARLRLMAEYSKDIIFYYQLVPTPSFEYVSPAIAEIVGLPPEALQANPDIAIQMLAEEDRARVIRAISTGSEESIIARLIRPDGDQRWIEYRNFAFRDSADQLIAVGGSIRDITPRLEAQEALRLSQQYTRTLLEVIPDTVLRLDPSGEILDFVRGEVLGEDLGPASVVTGRNIKDALPSAFVSPARRLLQSALHSARLQRLEFEVNQGGEARYYEARCLPFGEDEVLLILRDFTAMKWREAEEERRRFRDELDHKVEQRIRTNPYGLTYRELAILHLVAEGSADKQIAESLGISIYTVNKHVGNILGKMNAASRTEAGVRAIREGLLG